MKAAFIDLIGAIACLFHHKWKILKEQRCKDPSTDETWGEYHLQCVRCGTIKFKSTY